MRSLDLQYYTMSRPALPRSAAVPLRLALVQGRQLLFLGAADKQSIASQVPPSPSLRHHHIPSLTPFSARSATSLRLFLRSLALPLRRFDLHAVSRCPNPYNKYSSDHATSSSVNRQPFIFSTMSGVKTRRQTAANASPSTPTLAATEQVVMNGNRAAQKSVQEAPYENIFLFYPNLIGMPPALHQAGTF